MDMDPGFVSAIFGLTGAAIGGVTSFASSWLVAWTQLRDKNREVERTRRERLFNEIINEASRLYGDALSHEKDDVADLVKLYALIAQARLVSSDEVAAAAERVMDTITDTYLAPNRTLHEMRAYAKEGGLDFLREFGEACRRDLAGVSHLGRGSM
jgi:hypothetical protein